MTVKHSIKCSGSEVLVRETPEKQYILAIQSTTNPLGFGNVLETFTDKEEAIRSAELFCRSLSAAKERGYYLENGHFVKPERERIPVAACFHEGQTEEGWIEQLSRG
ncbi:MULTISPECIES: hypothetical protein [Paenibacillus]|uniref:hypothetical protein n=1 Tax=Paenibacillus TaxID=44249 RepID=UPI0022B8FE35|nr:hypothetical protein [Paenibacillus caseinilyticus]MCZ8519696.1 hypothetical protein [Paenibacillus caseinilyticus]